MKQSTTILVILFFMGLLTAQKNKRISGNGNVTTIERITSDYDHIAISGSFDIELVEGSEGKITLVGEENILDHITTEVRNNKLVIKVEEGYNLNPSFWKKDVTITIPVEHINSLTLSGSGNIVGKKTIKTDYFETSMSGSGDITLRLDATTVKASMSGSGDMALSGITTNFEVFISGSGDINAYDLIADNVVASVSGSANIEVTANKKIEAKVSGSGDIDYRGNPEKINSKVSGSGDITKH
ncbi:DUF2807 domain-containing protein [Arenibacter sp. F26102]|uniref:head GIN domain-containing protein n=1 Tax=Arenibacter sp. F26102 TaxID=2926416 RepID=UPI001FF4732E|nr:head GIN domain-containing protein [Arenibacter sp. F26102]MCK0145002.1 DUF2807 domain-containing protein [Arenibacter sp. F26102]